MYFEGLLRQIYERIKFGEVMAVGVPVFTCLHSLICNIFSYCAG